MDGISLNCMSSKMCVVANCLCMNMHEIEKKFQRQKEKFLINEWQCYARMPYRVQNSFDMNAIKNTRTECSQLCLRSYFGIHFVFWAGLSVYTVHICFSSSSFVSVNQTFLLSKNLSKRYVSLPWSVYANTLNTRNGLFTLRAS